MIHQETWEADQEGKVDPSWFFPLGDMILGNDFPVRGFYR
jgi:hypothetical protein